MTCSGTKHPSIIEKSYDSKTFKVNKISASQYAFQTDVIEIDSAFAPSMTLPSRLVKLPAASCSNLELTTKEN